MSNNEQNNTDLPDEATDIHKEDSNLASDQNFDPTDAAEGEENKEDGDHSNKELDDQCSISRCSIPYT